MGIEDFKGADLTSIFADSALGPESKLAKNDWAIRRQEIEALKITSHWEALFDICNVLLTKARGFGGEDPTDARGADWLIWDAYVIAERMLSCQDER
jgi:hypothetical protein